MTKQNPNGANPEDEQLIDDLEAELRSRLQREDPPSHRYVEFARSIFDLKDIDVVPFDDLALEMTRSGPHETMVSEHHGNALTCELTEAGLTGYLDGDPLPSLVLQEPDGNIVGLDVGAGGSFLLNAVPARFRLVIEPVDGRRWATTWLP